MRHRPALCALLTAAVLAAPVTTTNAEAPSASTTTRSTTGTTTATTTNARVTPVRVTVTVTRDGIRRSTTGFRPGLTMFDVRSAGGGGAIELVRFRAGYDVERLLKDFGRLFNGDVRTVRRVNRKVEFYGGMPVERGAVQRFGVDLEAGRYHLVNLDRGTSVPLRVRGRHQVRMLPAVTHPVNYVAGNRFWAPRRMPTSGWIRQTNKTEEVHFTTMAKVKWSVTPRKIRRFLESGAEGEPPWVLDDSADALLLSPGRSFFWHYDVSRGKYVALCFWPSEEDGMPHALMGMWRILRLTPAR